MRDGREARTPAHEHTTGRRTGGRRAGNAAASSRSRRARVSREGGGNKIIQESQTVVASEGLEVLPLIPRREEGH